MTRWTVVPQNMSNMAQPYAQPYSQPYMPYREAANLASEMAYVENQNYIKGVNDALQMTSNFGDIETKVNEFIKHDAFIYGIIAVVIIVILLFLKVY
jgi:predicted RND superfamily exporter protein